MQKRSRKTEKRILQTALELFVRKGYHGTSIDEIMRKVGLTKGALYAHFASKGEIFEAVFIENSHRAVTALRSAGWPASYLGAHANTDPHITIGALQYGPTPAASGGGRRPRLWSLS